jgi:3-hydroxymyristoyl/3-hydroxydecanoyl-(acyl carrier protein) dehydratase
MFEFDDETQKLLRNLRKKPLYPEGVGTQVHYGVPEIERLIPHRDPMRLVDGIDSIDLLGRRIVGRRTLDPRDPVFAGHFPGHPVYPGVLQVETMGQLALCLASFLTLGTTVISEQTKPTDVRALKIIFAQYLEPLVPGDVVTLQASILEEDGMTATAAGQIVKQGRIVSLSLQEVYFVQ